MPQTKSMGTLDDEIAGLRVALREKQGARRARWWKPAPMLEKLEQTRPDGVGGIGVFPQGAQLLSLCSYLQQTRDMSPVRRADDVEAGKLPWDLFHHGVDDALYVRMPESQTTHRVATMHRDGVLYSAGPAWAVRTERGVYAYAASTGRAAAGSLYFFPFVAGADQVVPCSPYHHALSDVADPAELGEPVELAVYAPNAFQNTKRDLAGIYERMGGHARVRALVQWVMDCNRNARGPNMPFLLFAAMPGATADAVLPSLEDDEASK
jgi:hypothetical protein